MKGGLGAPSWSLDVKIHNGTGFLTAQAAGLISFNPGNLTKINGYDDPGDTIKKINPFGNKICFNNGNLPEVINISTMTHYAFVSSGGFDALYCEIINDSELVYAGYRGDGLGFLAKTLYKNSVYESINSHSSLQSDFISPKLIYKNDLVFAIFLNSTFGIFKFKSGSIGVTNYPRLNLGFNATDMVYIENFIFLTDGSRFIKVIDYSDTSSPQIIDSLEVMGNAKGMDIKDSHLYVADGAYGLSILDISEYTNPVSVFRENTPKPISTSVKYLWNQVKLTDKFIMRISLYDLKGRKLKELKNINSNSALINTGDLSKGIYFADIRTKNRRYAKKLSIVR